MIGRLTGNIIDKKPPLLVIDINGIGYEVLAPMSTFYQLPDINETVSLFTHLIVREDQHSLYGFATDNERQLFRTLIKVNGVGPKLALTILTSIEADQFVNYPRKRLNAFKYGPHRLDCACINKYSFFIFILFRTLERFLTSLDLASSPSSTITS